MATWSGVITNSGNGILNEWVNGKALNFDGAAAGQGTVAEKAMMAQTALVSQKQTASLLGGEEVSMGIRLKIRIAAPETAYTLNQYGVWASVTGGTSVMIALFQIEEGIPIPSKTESPDFVYTFYALIACSNAGTWTVNVDTSTSVTVAEMTAAIAESEQTVQANLNSHINNKANPHGVTAAQVGAIPASQKGVAGGVASLGSDGKVPAGQLPEMDYDPAGTAASKVNAHNANATAHQNLKISFTEAPQRANIYDGLSLAACLGKIKKWFADMKSAAFCESSDFAGATHAAQHASGGSDPITPASIGAAAVNHGTHVSYSAANPEMDGAATPGASASVARSDHKHPTDTSRAPSIHASQHGSGGSDPITPASIGAAAASHKHAAGDTTSGTFAAARLPTVPINKGGTNATTAAAARANLGTMGIVAIYGVAVKFSSGKVTYSHSAIKSTSVCIVQRRSGIAGSATTSMFGTTSGDGYVTIVSDNTAATDMNLNIIIINP